MKKLLLISLLFPFVLFGQLASSDGNLLYVIPEDCYPEAGLIQNLGTLNDTAWLDVSGNGNHVELVNSNAVIFDGVNNKIQGGIVGVISELDLRFKFIPVDVATQALYSIGTGTSAERTIYIAESGGNYIAVIYFDDATTISTTLMTASGGKYIDAIIQYIDGNLYIEVNGSVITDTYVGKTLNGETDSYELIGGLTESTAYGYTGTLIYSKTIGCEIPYQVGESNKVYCVNSDVEYTILGTTPVWTTQNYYHYNIENGFSLVGTAKIPASRLNVGYDVLGNVLTNPPIKNGHNGAETELRQINDLSAYDTNSFWYTGTTPNDISYSDIQSNTGNYLFAKVGTNSKSKILFYNTEQSATNVDIINRCFLNQIKWLLKL